MKKFNTAPFYKDRIEFVVTYRNVYFKWHKNDLEPEWFNSND